MQDTTDAKKILAYLRDMIDLSRQLHRPDMVDLYCDAWEVAATQIYGALPPRKPNIGHYVAEPKPTTPPVWRHMMLAKPFRKIIARDGDTEILECGHRIWNFADIPGSPPAKRRRCGDCARANETRKDAGRVTRPPEKAAGSA